MVEKERLHLGSRVVYGVDRVPGIVDGLSMDWVGIRLDKGGYVIADWEDVEEDE